MLFSGLLLYSAKLRDRSGNVRASQDAGIDEAAEQTLVQFLLVRGTWLGDVVLRVQLEVFRERKRSGREMVSREALDEVNDVILLAESDGTFRTITKDVTAKYPVEFTKIFDAELGVKGLLEVGDEEEGGGSDDEIINVDAKVASGTAIVEEVDTGVSLTLGESLLGEVLMEGEIPFTRRILETVDALVELQDLAFVVLSVEEADGFIHRREVVSGVARCDKAEAFGYLEVGRLRKFKFKFTDNSLVSILDVVLRGRLVGTSPALCSPNPNVLIIPEVSNMAGSGTQLGIGCVLLGNAGGR